MSTSTPNEKKALETAVWATVKQIAQEESNELGRPLSEAFIASLANVVYQQIEIFALDTEAFATHARRSVVNVDDVLLCARRNDSLHQLLSETSEEITRKKTTSRSKQ